MFTFLGDRPLRLLVVDDDVVDRRQVLRVLRTIAPNVEITDVAEALAALSLLRTVEFDCAILDLYMPPHDGLWLLLEARAAGIATPVVMLTGQGDEQAAVALMKAGASDYIPKAALSATRLAQSIRQAIRVQRAEQQAHHSESALRASEQRLRIALRAADLGIWDYDPQGGTLEWDERSKELFGLPSDAHVDYGVFLTRIHPEDRERVHAAKQRAQAGEDGGDYSIEYRAIGPDGGPERWIAAQGRVLFDAERRPVRFIGTVRDVSERKRGEHERSRLLDAERQARAAAEAASRTRDDLIAVVSHDLRNPLGTIVTSTQLLKRLGIENVRAQRQLETILRSARAMERLISDLLDLASIEAKSLPVELKPCEADLLLREAGQLFGPLVEAKGLRFIQETVGGPLPAHCDRDRILQVLSNLVGNAIKFTKRGSISLRVRALEGDVLFSVSDTGSGIAAEHLPHIFTRYFQGEHGGRQGVGLGLSIARGIIEAHGGRVWAESAPGAGTTVFFTLPRCAPADASSVGSSGERVSPAPPA